MSEAPRLAPILERHICGFEPLEERAAPLMEFGRHRIVREACVICGRLREKLVPKEPPNA